MAPVLAMVFEWRLIVPLCFMIATLDIGRGSGTLTSTNDCPCPGENLAYNCSVTGSGFTIWRGSAFNCPNVDGESRIRLRHSSFGASGGTTGVCNDGAIIGRSIQISRDSLGNLVYTSQLVVNVTASPNVIGQTVECVYLNPNGENIPIGSTIIEVTDPLPPPMNVQLHGVTSEQLTFNWTSVDSSCSRRLSHYRAVSDCGTCPNRVDKMATSATCSIAFTDVVLCSFSIQSVICANLAGNLSPPLNVTLKVPQAPMITSAIPHYNVTNSKLIDLNIKFKKVESFMISYGVDGSAMEYTITYTDSNTGDVCETLTIPASTCIEDACTVPSISPLPCSERIGKGNIIDIMISATNLLGTGPTSLTSIGQTNTYVNISLELTKKRIVCTFLGQQGGQGAISCDFAYGRCLQEPNMIVRGTPSSQDTVIIRPSIDSQLNDYCYVINAGNGTFTTLIEGVIVSNVSLVTEPSNEPLSRSDQGLVAGVATSVGLLLVVVLIVVIVLIYLLCRRRLNGYRNPPLTVEYAAGEEEANLLSDEGDSQSIPVHVLVDLEDKPKELMNVLQKLEELQVSFKNIKAGPIPSSQKHATVRRIYMQFANNLREDQREAIENLQIGIAGSLHVFPETEVQEYIKDKIDVRIENITEYIEDKVGAFVSLLKVIYSVEECKHINIIDIDAKIHHSDDCVCIVIKFLPDMAEDWKEKYYRRRSECNSIVNPPDRGTTL